LCFQIPRSARQVYPGFLPLPIATHCSAGNDVVFAPRIADAMLSWE
jgi:hypothetical protein